MHRNASHYVIQFFSLLFVFTLLGCSPERGDSATPAQTPASESLIAQQSPSEKLNNSRLVHDWPNLFGPTFDCVVPGPALQTNWDENGPPELWRRDVGTGYSSPIVVRGKAIVLHRDGDEESILCCDAANGKTIWEHRYPTSFQCEVNYTSGPYSTPASDGQFVFTIGAEGKINCLELDTGSVVWERDLKTEFDAPIRLYGIGHTPLIWNDNLYLNVGGKKADSGIVCFNKYSGNIIWSATNDGAGYATPRISRIHDRDWLFVLSHEHGLALNPHDGTESWRIPLSVSIADAENAVSPVVYKDTVTFSSYGNGTVCSRLLPNGTREELWSDRRSLTTQYTPIVCIDGYAYGFHCGDHSYRCIDIETGKMKWRSKGKLDRSMIGVSGNAMVLFDENGRLASIRVNPEEFEMISISQPLLGETKCFASPAFSDQRMYLRSEGRMVCLDMKK